MSPEDLLKIARETIEAAPYSFLMTLDESGAANARLMQDFKPEADLTVWFGTSPRSRKVREIRRDNRVTVSFQVLQENAYVTLIGTAEFVDDAAERRRRWYKEWIAFFPAGPEGEDYVLIKFTPARVELLNFTWGVNPLPYGLQHANLVRTADGWAITTPP